LWLSKGDFVFIVMLFLSAGRTVTRRVRSVVRWWTVPRSRGYFQRSPMMLRSHSRLLTMSWALLTVSQTIQILLIWNSVYINWTALREFRSLPMIVAFYSHLSVGKFGDCYVYLTRSRERESRNRGSKWIFGSGPWSASTGSGLSGAVLAQKFWEALPPSGPLSPSPFSPFSETGKNTNFI